MLGWGAGPSRVGRAACWVLVRQLCQGSGCWWPRSQREHFEEAVYFSPLSCYLQEQFCGGFLLITVRASTSVSPP